MWLITSSAAAPHLTADGGGDAADLAVDPNPNLLWLVVPSVALVDANASGLHAGELVEIGDHGTQGMVAIEGVAVHLSMSRELSPIMAK